MEPSGRTRDLSDVMIGGCPIRPTTTAPVTRTLVLPAAGLDQGRACHRCSTLAVAVPPKLRVTGGDVQHMAFYLRVFLRLLSSWVHHCDVSGGASLLGMVPMASDQAGKLSGVPFR